MIDTKKATMFAIQPGDRFQAGTHIITIISMFVARVSLDDPFDVYAIVDIDGFTKRDSLKSILEQSDKKLEEGEGPWNL